MDSNNISSIFITSQRALTQGRTDHFSNILADREFSAGCY